MARRLTHVLVTGSRGFIGQNAMVRLSEFPHISTSRFDRGDDPRRLYTLVAEVDAVVHLAGEHRPEDPRAFEDVNAGLTATLCDAIHNEYRANGRHVPLILSSSLQAANDTPYGRSKRKGEMAVESLSATTGNPSTVFRLPGVFGKWSRPNYNSVVATFCHNIARGLPIRINDPATVVRLVYIDDVIDAMMVSLEKAVPGMREGIVMPEYSVTLQDLAEQLSEFHRGREALTVSHVGTGLARKLYATYLTHLPKDCFSYEVTAHKDARGRFVEFLKTKDSGQLSYFTAEPGVTRGGHYHHTKSEKFLVLTGTANFRFRSLADGTLLEISASGERPQVVETIPGWSHEITNIGSEELLVMLWANEVFDRERPDTVVSRVGA